MREMSKRVNVICNAIGLSVGLVWAIFFQPDSLAGLGILWGFAILSAIGLRKAIGG